MEPLSLKERRKKAYERFFRASMIYGNILEFMPHKFSPELFCLHRKWNTVRELLSLNVQNADENGTNKPDSRIVLVYNQMQTVIYYHRMLKVIQKLALMKILKMKSCTFYSNLYLLKLSLRCTMYSIFKLHFSSM